VGTPFVCQRRSAFYALAKLRRCTTADIVAADDLGVLLREDQRR